MNGPKSNEYESVLAAVHRLKTNKQNSNRQTQFTPIPHVMQFQLTWFQLAR